MGFGWTGKSFVRISGKGPFKLEFYPAQLIPNSAKGDTHYVWWDRESSFDINAVPVMRNTRAKRHFVCYVNENGEIV